MVNKGDETLFTTSMDFEKEIREKLFDGLR